MRLMVIRKYDVRHISAIYSTDIRPAFFTRNITDKNNISYVNCFNSKRETKFSYVKLIFICESSTSYVKYMFRTPTFHMWNFEPFHYT